MTDDASTPKPDAAPTSGATPTSDAATDAGGLSAEAVQMIRRQAIFGDTPRRSTQFQKGQSGNPKGRPRKIDREASVVTAQDKLFLKESRRVHTLKEDGKLVQKTGEEIILLSTIKAAVNGNAMAQKTYLQRSDRAAIAEMKKNDEENAPWQLYKDHWGPLFAEAKAKGEPEPKQLPHPDDVILEPGKKVRFCGPLDEKQLEQELWIRDVVKMFIAQDVHDRRMAVGRSYGKITDYPNAAEHLYKMYNSMLSKRLQYSEGHIFYMQLKLEEKNKRELMTFVVKAWKSFGLRFPRGGSFGDISKYEKTLQDLARMMENHARMIREKAEREKE